MSERTAEGRAGEEDLRSRIDGVRASTRTVATRISRIVFGDRVGLIVFLATLAGFAVVWRVGITISDTYTVANGLAALGDGHLHVEEPLYGSSLDTPGMALVDGQAYPRNIAQIVFALPFLWAMKAITWLAYPRVAIAAGWSLALLGLGVLVGREIGRETVGRYLGSAVATAAFVTNVALTRTLPPDRLVYLALQLSTMVVAAFCCVVLYRLLARMHGRRIGVTAGLATGVATPTLLWASIPKRHVLTATFTVITLYLFHRGRASRDVSTRRLYRAAAYVPVGLTAWLHAGEALVLLAALAVVDIATAEENDPVALLAVAGALLVSLIPFFITNTLMAGNPLKPPRLLPDYRVPSPPTGADGGGTNGTPTATPTETPNATSTTGTPGSTPTGTDTTSPTATPPPTATGTPPPAPSPPDIADRIASARAWLATALSSVTFFTDQLVEGATVVLQEPQRVVHTFVRSGQVTERGERLAIELTVVESMPLLGAAVALPVLAVRRLHANWSWRLAPTDLLVVLYGLLLTLLYMPRLPLHVQLTVRYLFPLYPLGIYALARAPWVRNTIRDQVRVLTWTYTAGVLFGAQIALGLVAATGTPIDETMQGFAYVALGLAVALVAWSFASTLDRPNDRVGAVLLGLAGATTTDLVLLLAVYYFQSATVLPVVPTV